MLFVPNYKKFRVGEEVNAIVDRTDNRMVKGEIVYIHPTNGWMTIRVKRVFTRSKDQRKGRPTWSYFPRNLEVPYLISLWFSEAFRGDYEPVADMRKSWEGAKEYADAG